MDWAIIWTIIGSAVSIIGIIITLFTWLRGDIKEIEKKISDHDREFGNIRTDLAVIKTLLLHKESCMIKDERQIKKAE